MIGARRGIRSTIRPILGLLLCMFFPSLILAQGSEVPLPSAERPALSVESLEFIPGQGREPRSFRLYQLPDQGEAYLDLWDATQILQANRYFDPVTRKVALGLGENRVKLTDGSDWIFFDSRPRMLGAPCRIIAGRMYLPLSFWPLLLDELPGLPLKRDPDALRLIGGLRSVNVLSVEWILDPGRLRAVFQLGEPLDGVVERLADRVLRVRFGAGRLAEFDWRMLPSNAPIDSLTTRDTAEGAQLDLFFRQTIGEVRSVADAKAHTWAFTVDLPKRPGLLEPEFEGELSERLPGPAIGRRLERIVIDPGHGGRDLGAVTGVHAEKDWNLRVAKWLAPYLEAEGFKVLWTRRDDVNRRPSERTQAANVANADLYLSLHFTRRGANGEAGMEIFLQDAEESLTGSGSLSPWPAVQSEHVESSLEIAAGFEHVLNGLANWPQLGIRRERTAVLEGLDMPALMLEFGNLDSPAECAAWDDPPTRELRLRTLARVLASRAERWSMEGKR